MRDRLLDLAADDEDKSNSRLIRKKIERLSFEMPAGASINLCPCLIA